MAGAFLLFAVIAVVAAIAYSAIKGAGTSSPTTAGGAGATPVPPTRMDRFKTWWGAHEGMFIHLLILFIIFNIAIYMIAPDWYNTYVLSGRAILLQILLLIVTFFLPKKKGQPSPQERLAKWSAILLIIALVLAVLPIRAWVDKVKSVKMPSASRPSVAGPLAYRGYERPCITGVIPDRKVETEIRKVFGAQEDLLHVVRCYESGMRHTTSDGRVLVGLTGDIGVFQINPTAHATLIKELGADIRTLEGNIQVAKMLYDTYGMEPWKRSPGRVVRFTVNLKAGEESNAFRFPRYESYHQFSAKLTAPVRIYVTYADGEKKVFDDEPGKNTNVGSRIEMLVFYASQRDVQIDVEYKF